MRHNLRAASPTLLSLLILGMVILACQQPTTPNQGAASSPGSTLTIKANTSALPPLGSLAADSKSVRSLTPTGVNFAAPLFTLTLSGPANINLTNSTGLFSLTNMANGTWSYSLTLTSSTDTTGTVLGSASGTFTTPNGIVLNPVLSIPSSGTSEFQIDLSWPSSYSLTPTVTLVGSSTITLTKTTVSACSYSYTASAVSPGCYTLSVGLNLPNAAEGITSWGDLQSVFFYGGKKTSHVYALTSADLNRPGTPSAPSVAWVEDSYSMAFHPQIKFASVSGATQYRIYRNGTQVGISNTTTFTDANLNPTTTSCSYTVVAQNGFGDSLSSPVTTTSFPSGPFYVAPGGTGDGTGAGTPLADLQTAMDLASTAALLNASNTYISPVTVNLASGTYAPQGWPALSSTNALQKHFTLRSNVSVVGAGASTILSGDLGTPGHAYHILYNPSGVTGASLSNLTIQGGNATDSFGGGGLYAVLSASQSLSATSVVFSGNTAVNGGGAVWVQGTDSTSQLTLNSCQFSGNSSSAGDGGAVHLSSLTLSMTGSQGTGAAAEFYNNSTGASNKDGGALYLEGVSGTIIQTNFETNTSQAGAGAVKANSGSVVTFDTCSFNGNTAVTNGGAVLLDNSPSVTYYFFFCNFGCYSAATAGSSNKADRGGALYQNNSKSSFSFCNFLKNTSLNTASGIGGALFINSGTNTCSVCTFTKNESRFGGAVHGSSGADLNYSSCVFSSNQAYENAGAINLDGSGSSAVTMRIADGRFEGNQTSNGGGGALMVYGSNASARVLRTSFISNTASGTSSQSHGAAVRLANGGVGSFVCSYFFNNEDNSGSGAGALYSASAGSPCGLALIRCTIMGNTQPLSTNYGADGALWLGDSTQTGTALIFGNIIDASSDVTQPAWGRSFDYYWNTNLFRAYDSRLTITTAQFNDSIHISNGQNSYDSFNSVDLNEWTFRSSVSPRYGFNTSSHNWETTSSTTTLPNQDAHRGINGTNNLTYLNYGAFEPGP